MVGGEQDPLHAAKLKQLIEERRQEIEAAGTYNGRFTQIGVPDADCGYLPGHNVYALGREGQPFANDLQFGKALEYAAEDEANDVNRRFFRRFPSAAAFSVDPTMSVKSIVASTLLVAAGARKLVRNSSTASAISPALSPRKGRDHKLEIARLGDQCGEFRPSFSIDGE